LLSFPGMSEAAVVGIDDARWGEVGAAALVLRPGATCDEPTIRAHCDALLARYKIPKRFLFVDALPRNGAGKVLKPEVKRLFADAVAA
jgi:fatty-acyl-CoA synthase